MESGTLYRLLEDQCIEVKEVPVEPGSVLEATGVFCFSREYPGFSGHFPGNPVLPAIVQLATVRYTAERATGNSMVLLEYSRTKFRSIVKPGDLLETTIKIEEKNGVVAGSFSLNIQGDTPEMVATGNCVFKKG